MYRPVVLAIHFLVEFWHVSSCICNQCDALEKVEGEDIDTSSIHCTLAFTNPIFILTMQHAL